MEMKVAEIAGIGEFEKVTEKNEEGAVERELYKVLDKVFLVLNKKTFEVRCDTKLSALLRERYESVMESRYYGKGGIEVVNVGQLTDEEVEDLVRLSYNLTKEQVESEQ